MSATHFVRKGIDIFFHSGARRSTGSIWSRSTRRVQVSLFSRSNVTPRAITPRLVRAIEIVFVSSTSKRSDGGSTGSGRPTGSCSETRRSRGLRRRSGVRWPSTIAALQNHRLLLRPRRRRYPSCHLRKRPTRGLNRRRRSCRVARPSTSTNRPNWIEWYGGSARMRIRPTTSLLAMRWRFSVSRGAGGNRRGNPAVDRSRAPL